MTLCQSLIFGMWLGEFSIEEKNKFVELVSVLFGRIFFSITSFTSSVFLLFVFNTQHGGKGHLSSLA